MHMSRHWSLGRIFKAISVASTLSCLAFFQPLLATGKSKEVVQELKIKWQEFHSVSGCCSMLFPRNPEHISEKMSGEYDLKYDAYVAMVEKKTVFMLLVAKYPDFVDESYAQVSLESFLNGLLSHNPSNQLIFADLVLVGGREALDFFIRTGSVFFKGRAMMVKNSLYLMAMECEMQHYDETDFNQFINSFKLRK